MAITETPSGLVEAGNSNNSPYWNNKIEPGSMFQGNAPVSTPTPLIVPTKQEAD